MAEKQPIQHSRPRPGPRPRHARPSAGHGSVRRRTAHRPPPKRSPAPIPSRRTADAETEPSTSSVRWWAVGSALVVVGLILSVFTAPFFEANTVQISGVARTSDGAIFESLAIPDDQSLLTYNTGDAADAIAALPWVKSAAVSRQWPSTVRVVVRERAVVAAVGGRTGRNWAVVGEEGIVVEHRMTPPSGVPLIIATDEVLESADVAAPIRGVDRALAVALDVPLQLDPWITTWRISDRGELIAQLIGSAEANFGIAENHRTQFVSLASILDGGAALVCLDLIDLSVADTPVLHRDTNCLLEARELG